MFAKKLSCLMTMTKTTNTELALAISLSESCISRWKNGRRNPPKKSPYVPMISDYFAKKVIEQQLQFKFTSEFTFKDDEEFADGLKTWLYSNSTSFDSAGKKSVSYSDSVFYYGDDGKRNAVLRFFENAKEKTNKTLFLYSDENMSWMLEKNFLPQWSSMLVDVLKNGNKIKIIHTVARDYTEIFNAVSQWIPMYLAGKIEPFYFPKLRDGIHRRTIFISSNEAIVSTSVEQTTDGMLNIYIANRNAVAALKKEFNNYLTLCRPLIKIVSNCSSQQLSSLFSPEDNNIVFDSSTLSLFSMPNNLLEKAVGADVVQKYLFNKEIILHSLKKHFVIDIINISSEFSDNIPYCLKDNLYYTKEEYIEHLKNIIEMINTYPNYYIILKNYKLSSSSICITEDARIFIHKDDKSPVLLSSEPNIVKAFWEYYSAAQVTDKKKATEQIEKIIESIK